MADLFNQGIGLAEVKYVQYQALTQQLRDFIAIAHNAKVPFYLITRADTYLTRPVRALIDAGVIQWIPMLDSCAIDLAGTSSPLQLPPTVGFWETA